MSKLSIKCPAGEERHPVLSPNPLDVECRIQGNLRPGRRHTGEPVVCCAEYTRCSVWMHHVHIARHGPSTKAQRDQMISEPAKDTLST